MILYILLTGEPPFNGDNDDEIIDCVKQGYVDFDSNILAHISQEGKNLLKKMLTYDNTKRISSTECLEDFWIKHNVQSSSINKEIATKVLTNLKNFSTGQKLMEATLSYIVNQLVSKEEVVNLKKVFNDLDENGDGRLSKQEIADGYKRLYGEEGGIIADKIFESVDIDKNGFISYEEFITASIDKTLLLTDQKLENAFKLFDKNGDGSISAGEIKEVLGKGKVIEDEVWNQIVNEVDINGDGEISLEEFKKMMLKILR